VTRPADRGRTDREHWEAQARNWAAFTRGPLPDAYVEYAPRFFELLPPPGRATLEVGCGEGRVCRDLRARGYDPTGIDAAPTMVELAIAADPAGRYLVADAAALPFDDGSFDLVVAYNSLMDMDDLDGAVAQVARVLEPGGCLAVGVTHPFADAGGYAELRANSAWVMPGDHSYLATSPYELGVTRNGVTMTFGGWARPLSAYAAAFEAAGLLIEAIREPSIPDASVAEDPAEARWARIPMFLWLRLRNPVERQAGTIRAP
jgi:SAM-dependent methyltransferase